MEFRTGKRDRRRRRAGPLACLGLLAPLAAAGAGESAPQTVVVTAVPERPGPAVTAITLDRSSPQSLLTAQAIAGIATPFSDFGTLAALTPSFTSSTPNGTGFDAAKNMTLRGFADGQFNVTLDGIPFQDPDSFGHHSTSVFPAATLDHLTIDRSPGSASGLGYATIGGTIDIATLQIPTDAGVRAYGAYGSFATAQAGLRLNTARPAADGQTGVLVNLDHQQSDGAMSHAYGSKDDLLLKSQTRLGDSRLTVLYSYDRYHFYNPPSVTTAQLAQFGSGFGFTATPDAPSYYGDADTHRHTDFGYLRWRSGAMAGWQIVETLYTYSYSSVGLSLKGDASSATSSPVGSGYGVAATDIAGRLSNDAYRTWGNIVQAEHAEGAATLRAGLWIERSRQKYSRLALDLTTGAQYDINRQAASPVLFDYTSSLQTVQPFAEVEWLASPELTLRGGLRWQRVRRGFDASVVPNSLPGTAGEVARTVDSTLPSVDGRYAFDPQTQAYLQWATGALVPNQSFFYTNSPGANNQARPENAQAIQAGFTRVTGNVDFTVDAYTVDLKNDFSSVTVSSPSGNTTQYVNNGKVRYQGFEFEGQARLGAGFSALANYSLIRARFMTSGVTNSAQKAGDTIPLAPSHLGLFGVLYDRGPWSGSLITKFVGDEYQGRNGSADGPGYHVASYAYTNLTLARTFDGWPGMRHARIALQVANVENRTPVTDAAGPSVAGPLLVNVLARRSVLLTFGCDL